MVSLVVEVVSCCREALLLHFADPIKEAIGLYSLLGLAITTIVSLPPASSFSTSHPLPIKLHKMTLFISATVKLCLVQVLYVHTYEGSGILPLRSTVQRDLYDVHTETSFLKTSHC